MVVCSNVDVLLMRVFVFFFFFNDTATTEIYTLSLHDALPISPARSPVTTGRPPSRWSGWRDRKSTRLNSSHVKTSYAVFCLKKKKINKTKRFTKKKKNFDTNKRQTLQIT